MARKVSIPERVLEALKLEDFSDRALSTYDDVSIPERVLEALKLDCETDISYLIQVSIPERVLEALKLASYRRASLATVSIPERVLEALKLLQVAVQAKLLVCDGQFQSLKGF